MVIVIIRVWNSVWPYIIAVLLFLVLIIIREFGHFLAAKIMGVRVNEFAVGFGPKLFSKKIGETVYAVNLIPLGGYCAMEGEDSESEDTRAFCNKKAWKRFIIVVMGATFNLILGFVIVACILMPTKKFSSTVVAKFDDNAISYETGLRENDRIYSVNGRKIFTVYDLSYAFTNIDDGKIDITVIRNGKKVNLKDVTFTTTKENGISYLDVDFYVYGIEKTFGSFIVQTGKTSISYCVVIWRSLIDLISGKYGISAMSGPVGVTVAIGNAARQNLMNILPIMALITINLGIFNLLPLPALDGGRLLFIIIEMILRKPVPQKYEAIVHTVGFFMLLAFMLFITAKDIWSLISG
ncbi:MAG: site-2 protease family protein [Clostridia bacterium]|nr:site-2 protease family protein [Clostridia bacterium]